LSIANRKSQIANPLPLPRSSSADRRAAGVAVAASLPIPSRSRGDGSRDLGREDAGGVVPAVYGRGISPQREAAVSAGLSRVPGVPLDPRAGGDVPTQQIAAPLRPPQRGPEGDDRQTDADRREVRPVLPLPDRLARPPG